MVEQVEEVVDEADDDDGDQPMANTILQTTTFHVDHAAPGPADGGSRCGCQPTTLMTWTPTEMVTFLT